MRKYNSLLPAIGRAMLLLVVLLPVAGAAQLPTAEIPVTRGYSKSVSGMFYYDVEQAEDMKYRKYLYTLCPKDAGCMSLNFTLLESGTPEDFIRIYMGEAPEGKPIATLGGKSGDSILQIESGCITLEFMRNEKGVHSAWTALWNSTAGTDCGPLRGSPQECQYVQEICGPVYHENFRYFGNGEKEELKSEDVCIKEEHNSIWYRFHIRRDGDLSFLIVPDNFYDDYDWVLWKADPMHPEDCAAILGNAGARVACNYSSAKGTKGATGMNAKGEGFSADADGNPFCKQTPVKRGDVFYLMVDDFSQKQSGFRLELGDVVRECEDDASREFVQLGRETPYIPWKVPPEYQFTRQTKVLRIDMTEKMNQPIATATCDGNIFEDIDRRSGLNSSKPVQPPVCTGLVQCLMEALKAGKVTALAASDFRTPVHYGDILDAAGKLTAPGAASGSWWNPGKQTLGNYQNAFELIVDDIFNRNTGATVRQIKYIRILWTDGEGTLPDVNIAVFPYHEVQPILDKMATTSRHSDVSSLSLADVLEMNMFSALQLGQSGKSARNPADGQEQANTGVQFENYLWDAK